MATENGEEVVITGEELEALVKELGCPLCVTTRLLNIIDGFPNAQAFMDAEDSVLRTRCRCGEKLLKLIGAVKDRWFALKQNRVARFRLNKEFVKYMEERERVHAREMERLNPVFSEKDLQVMILFVGEEKLQYVDLRRLNEIRDAITEGERVKLKERYEKEKEERKRLAEEVQDRIDKDAEDETHRLAEALLRIARDRIRREERSKPPKPPRPQKPGRPRGRPKKATAATDGQEKGEGNGRD